MMFFFLRSNRAARHPGPDRAGRRPTGRRLCLEVLEDRTVPSGATIFVDPTHAVDATHTLTLQAALQAADPNGGDIIQIEPTAQVQALSQTGGTLAAAASLGATQITVTRFIEPSEVISVATPLGGTQTYLVDAVQASGANFLLTLHSPLATALNAGAAVAPVANVIGVGKPVTIQGDPTAAPFQFPTTFTLQLFGAGNANPVVLQNLVLSGAGGPLVSGATAGNLTLNNDQFTIGGSSSAVAVNVGGSETITNTTIVVDGGGGAALGSVVAGSLTLSGVSITMTGSSGVADASIVAGNETISDASITVGGDSIAIGSAVGGNETVSNTHIVVGVVPTIAVVSGGGGAGISSRVRGSLTLTGDEITVTGDGSVGVRSLVASAVVIADTSVTVYGDSSKGVLDLLGSLTITNSTITMRGYGGAAGPDTGVVAGAGAFTLTGSVVRVTNNPGTAVGVVGDGQTAAILNSTLTTGGLGTGLVLLKSFGEGFGPSGGLSALVEGDDFRGNRTGVQVIGAGGGVIDLGGGALGSLGGNDFRGYPAAGAGGGFAVAMANTGAAAVVSARDNVWGLDGSGNVIDPHTVVQDGHNNTGLQGTGTIDVGAVQLTAAQEYVQTLYRVLLGRAGTVQELSGWANLVPTLGASAVAGGIAHDSAHEAFTHLVDGFYLTFLHRQADAAGEAGWVAALAGGATEEQAIAGFLTSPEFAQTNAVLVATNNSDAGFVQALFGVLQGRSLAAGNLAQADIDAGVGLLGTGGRAGLVADFLTGGAFAGADGTFRLAAVRSFYGDPTLSPLPFLPFAPDLLHRTTAPTASETAARLNGNPDLLSIEIAVASDPEFFQNG